MSPNNTENLTVRVIIKKKRFANEGQKEDRLDRS